jgi:hypothetical protein
MRILVGVVVAGAVHVLRWHLLLLLLHTSQCQNLGTVGMLRNTCSKFCRGRALESPDESQQG